MREQLALLPGYLTAHLQLSLLALGMAAALSVPLGVWVHRRRRLEAPVLGVAGVLQTVPGLALLAVMVPLLAWIGVRLQATVGWAPRSIGFLPAVIALTLYGILPILRNTVVGLRGVDDALVEAARAVGMTPGQRLRRVELPLALPVIVAGLRTATVWVVGTATLSTPVGATSLGNYIFSGLQTRNFAAVMVGCAASAALALALDGLIRLIESGLARRSRSRTVVALALAAALCLYALGAWIAGGGARDSRVAVGAKTFTEQYILAELLAQQVEGRAGLAAAVVPSLGSTVAFDALRNGEIDLYVDYSGTIWATLMKRSEGGADRGRVLTEVEDYLSREHGIGVAARLGFENAYALAMRREEAERLGVASLTDLASFAPRLEIGGDYEFFEREEWRALERAYGLAFAAERSMDPSLMYQAVARDEVTVISAFSTDGRIAAFDLRVLTDELQVIPPYDALVLVGPRLRRRHPEAVAALSELEGAIDADAMRRLNLAVDRDGRLPADVAREFLVRLYTGASPPAARGEVDR